MFENSIEAAAAVRADYDGRPPSAAACQPGDMMIVKPDGSEPEPGLLWIMGFNGGETTGPTDAAGDTASARRWFRICEEAAEAVDSPAWIIGERVHWGSPNIPELVRRIGDKERLRQLLSLHAAANRTLLREFKPRLVWLTGLSAFMRETIEDYGLTERGARGLRDKRGRRLWCEFVDGDGVPWLATIHPTGARMSSPEFERVKLKLAELAGEGDAPQS